jgi:uncharacterized protein
MDRANIHLFATRGGHYFFDVNTNLFVNVSEPVFRRLGSMLRETEAGANAPADEVTEYIARLKGRGLLREDAVREIVHPMDGLLEYFLDRKLKQLTLQVTQKCNLRCEYCCYSGAYANRTHANRVMSWDTAKRSIDFLLDHSVDNDRIAIVFYGGEPLLEFPLIRKCVEYAEERGAGKEIVFALTTNGTLLNGEIAGYLFEHGAAVSVSLDGPRDIHDKNRRFAFNNRGTFDRIMENLEKIRRQYPQYADRIMFSAVLDPGNDLACSNEFFVNAEAVKDSALFPSFISNEYRNEEVRASDEFRISSKYEYFKILLAHMGRMDRRHVSRLLAMEFERLRERLIRGRKKTDHICGSGHHSGPCIPGVSRLFVTAGGDFFPCEKVSETSQAVRIGHIDGGFDAAKVRVLMNIGKLTESSCKSCFAFSYCTICGVFADTGEGLSPAKKRTACAAVRKDLDSQFRDFCALKELGCRFDDAGCADPFHGPDGVDTEAVREYAPADGALIRG